MRKILMIAAAVGLLFVPMLFSDMPLTGDSMGLSGQGTPGGGPQIGSVQYNSDGGQEKNKVSMPAPADNVSDILAFEEKINLTSQQAISLRLIASEARQEALDKSRIVIDRRREYDRSLNQNAPDFAYIRSMLIQLTEAQANALEAAVNAYEKAYTQLTAAQKANLSFFRALRQQENEKKAASASIDNKQTISTSTFIDNPSINRR
jgi:hypothetical protein